MPAAQARALVAQDLAECRAVRAQLMQLTALLSRNESERLPALRQSSSPLHAVRSHSPYLLDLASPDEVHVLTRKPDGEALVHPLACASHIRERVRELLLGELSYDPGEDAPLGKS